MEIAKRGGYFAILPLNSSGFPMSEPLSRAAVPLPLYHFRKDVRPDVSTYKPISICCPRQRELPKKYPSIFRSRGICILICQVVNCMSHSFQNCAPFILLVTFNEIQAKVSPHPPTPANDLMDRRARRNRKAPHGEVPSPFR